MADGSTTPAPAPATVGGRDGKLFAWDKKAGETVRLTPTELRAAFGRGDVGLIDGQDYPMLDREGQTRLVPAGQVEDALRKGGYSLGTQDDVLRQQERGPDGALRAVADGIINRGLGGFGDALTAAEDPEAGDRIRARAAEHPHARMTGEVMGGVAGTAALGALGGGAALAGAAPEASAATVAGTVARGALGDAALGAVHGTGDAVSEAALGRTNVTAESLIAHGGLGFALGGAAGGILRIPAARAARAADRAAVVEGATGGMPESIADAWRRMQDAYRNGPAIRAAEGELAAARGALEEAQPAVAKPLKPMPEGRVGMAEPARRVPGPNTVLEGLAAKDAGVEVPAALHAVLENDGRTVSTEKMWDLLKQPNSPRARAVRSFLEERGGPDAAAAFDAARSRDLRPFAQVKRLLQSAMPGEAAAARTAAEDLGTAPTLLSEPAVEAGGTRPGFRPRPPISEPSAPGPYAPGGFNDAAFAPPPLDESFANRVGAAERGLAEAQAAAPQPGMRGGGIFGRGAAAYVGQRVGGPVGQFVAEELVGANPGRMAGLARAGRLARDWAAEGMSAVANGAVRASDRLGLPRMVAPTTLAVLNAKDAPERRQALATRMEELAAYGDPESTADRAARGTAHFERDAPEAAQAVQAKAVEVAQYLAAAAPKPLTVRNPLNPRPSYDLISDRDAQRFAQLDATLQDPLRVVDEMRAGRVPAPEVMMAVRTLYPETYDHLRASFAQALADNPNAVSWRTTLRAAIAFGLAGEAHATLAPAAMQLQQQLISAPTAAPGAPKPSARPRRPRTPRGPAAAAGTADEAEFR